MTFIMEVKKNYHRLYSNIGQRYNTKKKKTFKIESFLYLKFKKKLILPEDGDVEIIARSNIWSLDVMAEENESEQQIVNV